MNYTDRWFEFPVRVYDGFEFVKTMIKEEKDFDRDAENAQPIESDWVVGIASVLPENILGWSDSFSKMVNVEQVEKEGFDLLIVETKNQGEMMCTWKREKFKKKLNEFMNKMYTQPAIPYVVTTTNNIDSINKEENKE